MADSTDLSGIWGKPSSPPAPPAGVVDLSSIWGRNSSSQSPSNFEQREAPPDGAMDLSSIWGPKSSPENGQAAAPGASSTPPLAYEDPNQPWYKRAFEFANTPLTESVFGIPEYRKGAGGFERAAESLVSNFTSPLSLGLTAATFGTAGPIESAGMTALKESGEFTAEQLPQIVKASEAALQATKELKPLEPTVQQALEAGGHDVDLFNKAKQVVGPMNLETQFGEPAVKEALAKKGFSPDEISALGKASETAKEARQGFTPVEDAVREAGVDPSLWKQGQSVLYKNGLTEDDLLGGNLVTRGAFQILRKTIPTAPISTVVKSAKTANLLLQGGFTYQQLESAAALSPRFLDALKEGDYDHAKEYGAEALIGGTLGLLGASHALHSAGETFRPITETTLRPSDEKLAAQRLNGERMKEQAVGQSQAVALDKNLRVMLGHRPANENLGTLATEAINAVKGGEPKEVQAQKKLELASVLHQVVTGGDADKAAAWHNALAEVAGREERLGIGPQIHADGQTVSLPDNFKYKYEPLNTQGPVSGLFYHGTKANIDKATDLEPGTHGRETGLYGVGQYLTDNPEVAKGYAKSKGNGATGKVLAANVNKANLLDLEQPLGSDELSVFRATLGRIYKSDEAEKELPEGITGKQAFETVRQAMEDESYHSGDALETLQDLDIDLRNRGYDGLRHQGGDKLDKGQGKHNVVVLFPDFGVGRPLSDVLREPGPENGLKAGGPLPENLPDLISRQKFTQTPKEYQDLVLDSLKRVAKGDLSAKELAAAKQIRDELDTNFQIGHSNDMVHHQIQDYMTRLYKDDNPKGKEIVAQAKQGRFATNVSMARNRVFDSHLTAMLLSPKQMDLDPIEVAAKGREATIHAAANKRFFDNLRDNYVRGSDYRPAAVLSGAGSVVQGQNGEDPRMYYSTNRVRKVQIADSVIDYLKKTDNFDRFMADGTIRDITPRVNPRNLDMAIRHLDEATQKREPVYATAPEGGPRPENGQAFPSNPEPGEPYNVLRQQLSLLKDVQNKVRPVDDLEQYNSQLTPKYAWDPQDYVSMPDGSLKDWNFVTKSEDGTPVFVKTDLKVHPEFAEYIKNTLGLEPSALQKNPVSRAALGAGTKLKHTLLSLSPFHLVQEALRAVMVGVNPLHFTGPDMENGQLIDPEHPELGTIIGRATQHGFTPGTDYDGLYKHSLGASEGLASSGGALNKIPGVGKTVFRSMSWYQDFLFKRYIPALKARSVELMFHEYQRLHPDWSVDRAAKAAAIHTNDTFGGQNWQALGRSATTQDWGRLMMLAPDWLESEMRSGARLFNKDEGDLGRAQVVKMAMGLWGATRVLNLLTTRSPHFEAPFGLAVRNKDGKETIFSVRTLPTDLLHAASDPVGFLKGRLSPTVNAGVELVSGRDRYGRKLAPEDLWADVFRNMAPIPVQTIGQTLSGTGPEVGTPAQLYKSVGGTAKTYYTPAEEMAANLAANHTEDGPVDESQLARHRTLMHIEDGVRSGETPMSDLYKMYVTGQLKQSDLKKITDNVRETHGMTPELASLYSRASRLPAPDYLKLMDQMNPSEKTALLPLTLKVRKRYLTKAMKDEQPEERMKDPVFLRFFQMAPQEAF